MDIYMYWLSTLYTMGSRKQNQLLNFFGNAGAAFNAPIESMRAISGFTENNIRTIQKSRNPDKLKYGMELLKKRNIFFTYFSHPDYPSLLKKIPDPPQVLFYIGNLPKNDLPKVAIIGSRRCSEYGLNAARRFGAALARHEVVVVSGMARGIDSMAHKGALEFDGGLTIAVLGCGVDICYPAENHLLRDNIAKNGCVISEYPPGVTPQAFHFPARNRIISGLSQILVVIEAGKKSGTLITVDQALDQGRVVMALPGNITNKYSEGTNDLIKQGAEPVCNYEDILHMLNIPVNKKTKKSNEELLKHAHIATGEKLVYDVMASCPDTPLSVEEIIIKANSQPQTIQHILTMLELKGYIKKLPGMRYVRRDI